MAKWDEYAEGIRSLLNRSRGVELDVSDDVLEAARRGTARPEPQFDGIEVGPKPGEPDMSLGSPLWHQMDKGRRAYDNLRSGRTANLRNQDPQLARIAGDAIRTREEMARGAREAALPPPGASAGWQALASGSHDARRRFAAGSAPIASALATVAGSRLYDMLPPSDSGSKAVGESPEDGPEALAEESRPVPRVEAQEDAPPAMPRPAAVPEDYRFQARELINKLNAMRRQAGGEVPEATAMAKEINRLLGLADAQRNAPGYQPAMPTDHHGEAQRLIQQLNAMRQAAGGEVPQAQQIMAEVRRHQALGDQMRNAR